MLARHLVPLLAVALLLVSWSFPQLATSLAVTPLRLTHGIASGDPTASTVVIWARASRVARMHVDYMPATRAAWPPLVHDGPTVGPTHDFTGKVRLEGLTSGTRYLYWVRFADADGSEVQSQVGQFWTTPADGAIRPLTLVWWADLGGQGYCRDPERGYALFTQMARLAPDLAIASGDSVYADGTCPPVTRHPDHPRNAVSADPETALHQLVAATDPRWTTAEAVLAAYRAKWKYNLEDEPYQRFRASTPHLYQWDDHEVHNDWFPGERSVGAIRGVIDPRPIAALAVPGRQALLDFTPIGPEPAGHLYRAVRLGRLAELFLLDVRSHRDDNLLPDRPGLVLEVRLRNRERLKLAGRARSLLGDQQRAWLLRGLEDAEARGVVWKLIASSQSVGLPSGGYPLYPAEGAMQPLYHVRDGWAAGPRRSGDRDGNQDSPFGAESELRRIVAFLGEKGIRNVVWLTGDVHHARFLRYEPGGPLSGYVFHEFTAGPASARMGSAASPASSTFGPLTLYARGPRPEPGRATVFNFGVVRIARDGTLTVEVRDIDGLVPADEEGRPGSVRLVPAPVTSSGRIPPGRSGRTAGLTLARMVRSIEGP